MSALSSKPITGICRKNPFQALLLLITLAGLLCKLLISLNLDLDSDMVSPGLVLAEMFRYGNYGLTGYYFPMMDPYVYGEIFPFHVFPQLLSGYDPVVLRLTGFLMFMAIFFIFSGVAYCVSGDLTKTLIFAALFATLSPLSYAYYATPVMHNATILYAGLFLLMWLIKKEKTPTFMALMTLASIVIVYSDSIFLACFVLPAAACFLLFEKRTPRSILSIALFLGGSLAAHLVKYRVPGLVYHKVGLISPADLIPKLMLLAERMRELLDGTFHSVYFTSEGSILSYFILALFILFLALAVFSAAGVKSREQRYLHWFFIVSGMLFVSFLIVTSIFLRDGHYLTFIFLMLLLVLAINTVKNRYVFGLMTLLLIASLMINIACVAQLDYNPDREEYELIEVLKNNDLTTGYGDYWDSNIITYLSGGDVTVRAVILHHDTVVPYRFLACERWYQTYPERFFIVTYTGKDKWTHDLDVPYTVKPESVYPVGNYLVYVFNQSDILYGLNKTVPGSPE